MSLIKCCECNTKVSEYADKCPNCGCPMSVIKKTNETINKYLIVFIGDKSIDLSGIEDKLSEENLKEGNYWKMLHEDYGADLATCSTISSMFKFNNYKFPDNYQDLYDAMCEHNVKSRETRESSLPKCPTCGSTNIEKISLTKKALGGVMFGILSSDVRKTMHCKKCGYKW